MRNKILIFLLSITFFSCYTNEKDSDSISFFNYLKKTHNLNPNIDEHYYIIIELDGCQQCNYKMIQDLNKLDINIDNLTIIGSYNGKIKPKIFDNLQIKYKINYENRKQFYKTSLGYLGNVIIKTKNIKIVEKCVIEDGLDLLSYFVNIKKK